MADSAPDGRLTNKQIVSLGANISARNMSKIATGYMDLSKEVVRNIADKNRDDQEGFTRELIEKWKNKPQNSDHNQVKKLATLLYQAADEGSYVDPSKIQEILLMSRDELGLNDAPVTEKELNHLAEKLRPITEQRTNIDLIQWAENNTVKMEDLYTELKIDKLENEPMGVQSISVNDYKELFTVGSGQRVKGKRVLGKGDPGNGKTTFAKKVAWDWAKGNLKDISLVFFVSMKLVSPSDLIEGMIIQQTPELEGLKVTEQKLKDMLQTFGSRCLVILDGYDEHISRDNKPNEDVTKLLKGQKLLSCNVLLTSRPHSVADLEQYFSTVVSIQGFTEKHAREFASRVLIDKDKIDPIMEIQCLNAGEYVKEGSSVFTCPLLLLFICVLVNADEIDLARKEVTLGEIYTRLVRCLYRKYTARKSKAFRQSEFVEVLKRVGLAAVKTLFNVKECLQRSEVIKDVGEDAFKYGLLIGHEDFRLSADETGDIIISFPHRTIQEFLAALYFILVFDYGESVESLDGCEMIMRMPLLFHFCLWFLGEHCTREYFFLENKDKTYRNIETMAINIINYTHFYSLMVTDHFKTLNVHAVQRDELVLRFVQKMLPKCKEIKRLLLDHEDHVGQVMSTLRPLLPQLSLIQVPNVLTDELCSEELHIFIDHKSISCADELLAHCKGLEKPLSVYLRVMESMDLSKYLSADISALHIEASSPLVNCLSGLHNIPYSPHLTCLNLVNQILDEDVTLALSNVVEKGNLPNLRHLGLRRCAIAGKLQLLFQNKWPALTHLDLYGSYLYDSYLTESDIPVLRNIKVLLPNLNSLGLFLGDKPGDASMTDAGLTEMSRLFNSDNVRFRLPRHIALFDMFESPMPKITELRMDSINKQGYKKLVSAVNTGNLPKLRELGISMWEHVDKDKMVDVVIFESDGDYVLWDVISQGKTLDWLSPVNAPTVTDLTLHRFICTMFHLAMVTQSTVLTKLHKLDISHSSGMTGTLSILLCHSFPSLNSLILSDCGLNSQDLCSLAQARAKDRLPELRNLDISRNDGIKGRLKDLFSCDAQWENLCSLNAVTNSNKSVLAESYQFCIHKGPDSNELAISESISFLVEPDNRFLKNVQEIRLFCDTNYIRNIVCSEILDALERGLLPSLNCVAENLLQGDSFMSMLQPLLANVLPNNVIKNVIEHIENFLLIVLCDHMMVISNYHNEKGASGEGLVSPDTIAEEAVETLDMSSVLSLVQHEGLSESRTKEMIHAVRTCLHRFMTERASSRNVDQAKQFRKYRVAYEQI